MTVSVIIPTYGDRQVWNPLAARAVASVASQAPPPDEIIRIHDDNLTFARNKGALTASSEWLIFLDASDCLEPGYLKAMLEASGDVRYPLVRYVDPARPATTKVYGRNAQGRSSMVEIPGPEPVHIPECNLFSGRNYVVIGAMVRRRMVISAGAFREHRAYEDYDLWLRLALCGAKFQFVPAVYRAYVMPHSRNQNIADPQGLIREILNQYIGEAKEKGLV